MKHLFILLAVLCSGCASEGYYYPDAHPFTQTAIDVCQRPALTYAGMISWLNGTKGQPDGVPHTVVRIQNSNEADPDDWTQIIIFSRPPEDDNIPNHIACHTTLVFTNHRTESGVFSVTNPPGNAPLQVKWMSDATIVAEKVAQEKQQAKMEAKEEYNLRTYAEREDAAAEIHIPTHCGSKLAIKEERLAIPYLLGYSAESAPKITSIKALTDSPRLKYLSASPVRMHYFLSCIINVRWSNGNLALGQYFTIWHDPNGQTMTYYGHHEYLPGSKP